MGLVYEKLLFSLLDWHHLFSTPTDDIILELTYIILEQKIQDNFSRELHFSSDSLKLIVVCTYYFFFLNFI